jgi:hypothetical protein
VGVVEEVPARAAAVPAAVPAVAEEVVLLLVAAVAPAVARVAVVRLRVLLRYTAFPVRLRVGQASAPRCRIRLRHAVKSRTRKQPASSFIRGVSCRNYPDTNLEGAAQRAKNAQARPVLRGVDAYARAIAQFIHAVQQIDTFEADFP